MQIIKYTGVMDVTPQPVQACVRRTHASTVIITTPALPTCHAFPAIEAALGLSKESTCVPAAFARLGYTGKPSAANLKGYITKGINQIG